LRADPRVRVPNPLQICLWCRSNSKNRDKQLTHIVRVKGRAALKVSSYESCYFELEIITMQELVDFGALLKSKRSRDKVVKADIN
jgi:hypothetical protein